MELITKSDDKRFGKIWDGDPIWRESLRKALTEKEEYERAFKAELEGNVVLRKECGAYEKETFIDFVRRLYKERTIALARTEELERVWNTAQETFNDATQGWGMALARAEKAEETLCRTKEVLTMISKRMAPIDEGFLEYKCWFCGTDWPDNKPVFDPCDNPECLGNKARAVLASI